MSVAKLLIAGLIPELLLGGIFLVYVFIHIALTPSLAPVNAASEHGDMTLTDRLLALVRILPFAIVVFSVTGLTMLGSRRRRNRPRPESSGR